MTNAGATSLSYDARGNLATNGGASYGYTSEDRLASGPGVTLAYDPLGRLHYDTADAPGEVLQYDGDRLVTEVSGGIDRRYVFGAGDDEPLVEYDGSGNRTWLAADERGSVVARANDAGAATAINRYDEYGVPGAGNVGRFGYTGQAWLPSVGLWYYKARMYAPSLGRFLQTDPVGYGAGMNWYGYAGGDPVNATDPSGLAAQAQLPGAPRNGCNSVDNGADYAGCNIPVTGGINLFNYPIEWGYGPISYRPGQGAIGYGGSPSQPTSISGASPLPKKTQSHRYVIRQPTLCSPRDAFNKLKAPGMSAPGAPAAREGRTPNIYLLGNNPITQTVNNSRLTINNRTEPTHMLYPGDVNITVTGSYGDFPSVITIIGTGTSSDPEFNNFIGTSFFGGVAEAVAESCVKSGPVFYP